jgi:hypothetical protein
MTAFSSALHGIDLSVIKVPVSVVVRDLRSHGCAAVSFLDTGQQGVVTLTLKGATVTEILEKIAAQNPAYRSEVISGRDVLYPAAPGYQAFVDDIYIQDQARQAATERYVEMLERTVPAFADLVPPVLFGDDRMPIFSDKVTLRPRGRVIEHFVDLLGQDRSLYFGFIQARSGLPSLVFDRVHCAAAQSPTVSRSEPLHPDLADCAWPEVSVERLLARSVESLSAHGVKVEVAVAELESKVGLPLSFIQAFPEAKVDLDLHGATVRQVLDAIVTGAPQYRYGIISDRLVLYPRDPKWELPIDHLHLGPGPRLQITRDLARELRQRLPVFATLGGPWSSGNGYTYRDIVQVGGPAPVLNLLVQLLGNRPSTYFLLVKEDGWLGPSLSVSSVAQLRSVKLSAAKTISRRQDETTQLRLAGTLAYDGSTKDLTSGACGTTYTVSDERVLTVSPDGLVTRRGSGKAEVFASNEASGDSVTFECHTESP